MAFKFIVLFALVANTIAIPVGSEHHHEPEHHAPAHYDFSYSVHDEHTGDIKSQHESRLHDKVHGSYSLIDSDGHKRTVDYTADHHNGFQAVVHRTPTHIKIPVPVHHAPVHHHVVAAPVHHVEHVAHVAHVAPVHHVAHVQHVAHHVEPVHHVAHVQHVAHHVAPVVHHVAPVAHHSHAHSHVSVHGAGGSYHY